MAWGTGESGRCPLQVCAHSFVGEIPTLETWGASCLGQMVDSTWGLLNLWGIDTLESGLSLYFHLYLSKLTSCSVCAPLLNLFLEYVLTSSQIAIFLLFPSLT